MQNCLKQDDTKFTSLKMIDEKKFSHYLGYSLPLELSGDAVISKNQQYLAYRVSHYNYTLLGVYDFIGKNISLRKKYHEELTISFTNDSRFLIVLKCGKLLIFNLMDNSIATIILHEAIFLLYIDQKSLLLPLYTKKMENQILDYLLKDKNRRHFRSHYLLMQLQGLEYLKEEKLNIVSLINLKKKLVRKYYCHGDHIDIDDFNVTISSIRQNYTEILNFNVKSGVIEGKYLIENQYQQFKNGTYLNSNRHFCTKVQMEKQAMNILYQQFE